MNSFRNRFSPLIGIVVFIIAMLVFIFLGAPIQSKLGMGGVAITELMILAMGVLPAIILKQDLKKVFPFKIPKIREIFGTLFIWVGTMLISAVVSMILMYFFPEGMMETSSGLSEVITSVPFIFSFLIVSVMPAICEEALHRGFILANFRPLKNKFVIVLSMGIIFGIFHLDFYRFLPTAILGAALSYIMVEADNMILPMLFHFINNFVSTVASSFSSASEVNIELTQEVVLLNIGTMLVMSCLMPMLYYFGSRWIKKENERRKMSPRNLIIVLVICVLLFISGVYIVGSLAINNSDILNTIM